MWDTFKPKDDIWYCWHLNGGAAYLRKSGDAWHISFKTIPFCDRTNELSGPVTEEPPASLPKTYAWGAGEEIFLHPYLSDQPYILKFRETVKIMPGQKAWFIAELPPLLKFELSPEAVLAEAMPLVPHKTLFGPDTMIGKLGYSLYDALAPKQTEETTTSILIQCNIFITNKSKTVFEMENFVIYPKPFNVYAHKDRLVADTMEFEILSEILGTEYTNKTNLVQVKDKGYRLISAGTKGGVGEIRHIIKDIGRDIL